MPEAPLADATVLLVEDEALLRRQLTAHLERAGADVTAAGDLAGARALLAGEAFTFALLDVNLPDGRGTDLLREGLFAAGTAVIVMTAEGGVEAAVEAMRLGAADFLTKPFEAAELPLVLARARRARQAARIEEHRREEQAPRDDEFFFGSGLAELRAQLDRILAADRRMGTELPPVLISGETGTGKTTIARWLHERGPRAAAPLVEVNCSALPETLAESELFGHERGAFTDARTARMGLFEAAGGGSLFLDELASLSLPLQAKLLTAIEDRRIRRLGGNKAIAVDVRIIAATNRDLRELIATREFREDLLHRLDLFRVDLPPLRARRGDIVPLAETLLRRLRRRHRLPAATITPDGARRLGAHDWPGNVRELAHELERALVFEGERLAFPRLTAATSPEGAADLGGGWFNPAFRFPEAGFSLETAVERLVAHALEQAQGNVSAAARLLGVSRDVVRYRIEGRARTDGAAGEKSPTD
ncbi:MAG: sigma-54-dependent transcriptional regulator [Limisphaerales bacterium]